MWIRYAVRRSERGVALVLTLLIATILLGLGLVLVLLAYIERTTSYQVQRERQTFYAADVETAYLTIARITISQFNNWDTLLGQGMTPNCNRAAPPRPNPQNPCPEQIPQSLSDFQGFECKGRILPVPTGSGWNLTNETLNPFRLRCQDGARFCNCRIVLPGGTLSPRLTLYIRDDPQDGDTDVFHDNNGDIQVIVVSDSGDPQVVSPATLVRTVLAFDLSRRTIIGNPCALPELTGACEQ